MVTRHYSNTAVQGTLTASVNDTSTTLSVDTVEGLPDATPFAVTLDLGTASEEVVLVTSVSGTTLTATRGYDGTAAIAHPLATTVTHTAIAADFKDAADHESASSGVHGLAGTVVGTSDAQTLTNKTLTSPTLSGTTSAADIGMSGDLAVGGTVSVSGKTTLGDDATVNGDLSLSGDTEVGGDLTVTGKVKAGSIAGVQSGTFDVTLPQGSVSTTGTVTFPKPYTSTPVFVCSAYEFASGSTTVKANLLSNTGATVTIASSNGDAPGLDHHFTIHWIAMGA